MPSPFKADECTSAFISATQAQLLTGKAKTIPSLNMLASTMSQAGMQKGLGPADLAALQAYIKTDPFGRLASICGRDALLSIARSVDSEVLERCCSAWGCPPRAGSAARGHQGKGMEPLSSCRECLASSNDTPRGVGALAREGVRIRGCRITNSFRRRHSGAAQRATGTLLAGVEVRVMGVNLSTSLCDR